MFALKTVFRGFVLAATVGLLAGVPATVTAASAAAIDGDVDAALAKLFREAPAAEVLASKAKAVLVFPSVVKGGLLIGGQFGEGALRKGGETVGYYNTTALSYGLQAGA